MLLQILLAIGAQNIELMQEMPFPHALMAEHKEQLGTFDKDACKTVQLIRTEKYFIHYTDDDKCDGGNMYGIVANRVDLSVYGYIKDQDFYEKE